MRYMLDLLYLLAGIIYSPVIIYRAIRFKRYRDGWGQRFGNINRKSPEKKCIWIHAVSVGEVNAAKSLAIELNHRFTDYEIVISTTTDTGFARAMSIFGGSHQVFYFPFDFSLVIRRAFKNIRPAICLLMELEVWPNFVSVAKKQNIPVVIVNGRISDKSFSGYMRFKPVAKTIFSKISLALAQTQEYANRFEKIGVPAGNVYVTGSLKYDTAQITDKVDGSDDFARQLNIDDGRLWVAGATGPGEEKIILDVFTKLKQDEKFKDLRLIVVPRKPERFEEVAELIKQRGFEFVRYSTVKDSKQKNQNSKTPVILGDTMGDLRKFYSLATIIFVGRSLVPMGGSDMMEAAALGKCTMFGPHTFNFKQTVDALLAEKGAVMVKEEKQLLETIQKSLTDTDYAGKIAKNGREVIRKNQGATKRTIEQIEKILS